MLSGYVKRVKSGKISIFLQDCLGKLNVHWNMWNDFNCTFHWHSWPVNLYLVVVCDARCGIGQFIAVKPAAPEISLRSYTNLYGKCKLHSLSWVSDFFFNLQQKLSDYKNFTKWKQGYQTRMTTEYSNSVWFCEFSLCGLPQEDTCNTSGFQNKMSELDHAQCMTVKLISRNWSIVK